MMTNQEKQFHDELEVLGGEAREAVRYFYCYLTFREVRSKHEHVRTRLAEEVLFWSTVLDGLITSAFITLHRIFDQESKHNIDQLLKIARANLQIFSKSSLRARKVDGSPNASEWIEEYMKSAYEPVPDDFRKRLRNHVKRYRKMYEDNYRDLRTKVFAHKDLSDESEIQSLFAKTNVRELEHLFVFPLQLYEALWQLYENGRKPNLRPMRFSHGRMLDKPARIPPIPYLEHIIDQTKTLLISIASRAV